MSVVDGKKGGKQSRFSTLRVFGKFNKNAAPGPPPLPPKDPVYLAARNRSLASLSPESIPASPLSGDQYAASSSSAVSLALSAPTKQRSGLFNFRKNAAVNIEASSPAADDDENISMPWNFQHNMHVDEGLSGLPPSWTTSLQEAGFSDDEIAAIQQRRLADRPRPQSPAVRPHSPAVLRPVPRSTSLPQNQQQSQGHTPASSLASSASVSSAGSSPVPELPRSRGASPKVEYGSPKVEYASPPAPKSPPPGYWRDEQQAQPQPLTIPRAQPRQQYSPQRAQSRSPPPSRSLSPSRSQPQQPMRSFSPALSQSQSQHSHSQHSQRSQPHSRSGSQASHHSRYSSVHSDFDDLDEDENENEEDATPSHARTRNPNANANANANTNTNSNSTNSNSNSSSRPAPKPLTLDLRLGSDPATGGAWSDAVLSATPWSAEAGVTAFLSSRDDKDKDTSFLPSPSPSSPLFTITKPGRVEAALSEAGSPILGSVANSYAAAPASRREASGGSGGSGSGSGSPRLAYDYDYADDYADGDGEEEGEIGVVVRSGSGSPNSGPNGNANVGSPGSFTSTGSGDRLGVGYGRDRDRDSGMSDTTMLAPPPSAGVVSRIAVARRAVAEVVPMPTTRANPPAPITNTNANAINGSGTNGARVGGAPPASPQSSHFGSSGSTGSSESQDHQTPVTEVAEDEDDIGALDYYMEGKSYLENNGFSLGDTAHRERGHGADHAHGRSQSREDVYGNGRRAEEEDEEERRKREWEAMQRGERDTGKPGRLVPPLQTQTKKTSPSPQASARGSPQGSTPARTPPTQTRTPPTQVRTPPTQTQTRMPISPQARRMVSATETFGVDAGAYDEEGDDEYEYGYEFPDPAAEPHAAVESPNAGAGGFGSAFGSPSAAPAGYGYGGGSGRASKEPGQREEEEEEEEDEEGTLGPKQRAALGLALGAESTRPTLITQGSSRGMLSPGPLTALGLSATPLTPAQRYAGWVAAAVAPLEEFIDEPVDPREFYGDLQEIAEGESGSVYAAALIPDAPIHKLKLPPLVKARDADEISKGRGVLVAIKSVALLPGGSQKLVDVRRELGLLQGLKCEQVLGMDALYVDVEDDALWIRMELMERSLADVVGLVEDGLRLQEPRIMARFANDMLQALDFLQKHHIAHRDLRSDNLLLNSEGVLKLTDFSNAISVKPESPLAHDPVGVMYWQAPEVRSGAYDPLKIDVWSVGATVWELAEAAPPFSDTQQPADRWPTLGDPALYPPTFHDFLRLCSEPAASRPTPGALLETPFVQKACGRPVIVQLLSRCMAIEQALNAGDLPPDSSP